MEPVSLYNSPDVANRIKVYAKSKGVTQKGILDACNLGPNTFSHMLHGRALAFDSLARIADVLGCSVDYLLGREASPAPATSEEGKKAETAIPEDDGSAKSRLLKLVASTDEAQAEALLKMVEAALALYQSQQDQQGN